jgi:hypothetical protein
VAAEPLGAAGSEVEVRPDAMMELAFEAPVEQRHPRRAPVDPVRTIEKPSL